MISKIGKPDPCLPAFKSQSGVTLIETLAAVIIISIGIIAVYQPLLRSLTVLHEMDLRLEANRLASDEFWLLRMNQTRLKALSKTPEQSQAIGADRAYDYMIESIPITEDRVLNSVRLKMEWHISGRTKGITQTSYVEIPIAN